jgi:hypothetical protein
MKEQIIEILKGYVDFSAYDRGGVSEVLYSKLADNLNDTFEQNLRDELIKFERYAGAEYGTLKDTEEFVDEYLKSQQNNPLLPCGENGCVNPHERIYRGCDICKFNKTEQK